MDALTAASLTPAASAVAPRQDEPKRLADAARQFESLLIAQLLKSTREAGTGGWMETGDDQAGAQAMELAEEQMAQALAQQGGFGLARMVASGLQKASDSRNAAAASQQRPTGAQKLQP
jgi:Rod binding domain-containing protein